MSDPKQEGYVVVEPIGAIFSDFASVVVAYLAPAGPGNPFSGHDLTILERLPDRTYRTTWYAT